MHDVAGHINHQSNSIVTVAENLGLTTVAALNHRDFRVVRPRHIDTFTLIL